MCGWLAQEDRVLRIDSLLSETEDLQVQTLLQRGAQRKCRRAGVSMIELASDHLCAWRVHSQSQCQKVRPFLKVLLNVSIIHFVTNINKTDIHHYILCEETWKFNRRKKQKSSSSLKVNKICAFCYDYRRLPTLKCLRLLHTARLPHVHMPKMAAS